MHESPDNATPDPESRWARGMTWLGKMRLRAMAVVVLIPVLCFGVLSIGMSWLTIPVVGVAVATIVSTLGSRFEHDTCWTCGEDLAKEDAGVHGVICPKCGSLNQHNPRLLGSHRRA